MTLLPQSALAALANVSKQRISALIRDGKLAIEPFTRQLDLSDPRTIDYMRQRGWDRLLHWQYRQRMEPPPEIDFTNWVAVEVEHPRTGEIIRPLAVVEPSTGDPEVVVFPTPYRVSFQIGAGRFDFYRAIVDGHINQPVRLVPASADELFPAPPAIHNT